MNRVPVVISCITALFLLAAMTGLVGCSNGGGEPTQVSTPDLTAESAFPDSPSGEGINLGYFQFVFDDDGTVRVEDVTSIRGVELNVGNKALIIIEDFWFNEETRNWHIVATIRNVSVFTGYDVWAVFHSLGNKFVLNTDGFLWAMPPMFPEPTRCPFIAYGKDQPDRSFPPMFQDTREIIIHQPEGVPSLSPIGFWVDAMGHPRARPGVEDLHVEPIDETNYHLTGYIWDHQSPSEDLTVWANTSNFNGVEYVQLFDDGQHGDEGPNDNIFGGDFSGNPDHGPYVITVYAFDPMQNMGENDVWFMHGGPCDEPLEPRPFETVDKGEHSGIEWEETVVVNTWDAWVDVWDAHTSNMFPPPPPPPVNFENHTVLGVWVGARPSNNHHVTITEINYDPCEDLVIVNYTYTPYTACGPLDVMTNPFHLVITPKINGPVYFSGEEVDCPPPPPDCVEDLWWETLIQGPHSSIKDPYQLRITNWEHYEMLWTEHTADMYPPPPMPMVDFEEFDLVAVAIGERPTGGFECEVERVCRLNNQDIAVFYKEWIPGPDCPVPMVLTQPFHWVLIHKDTVPVQFFKSEEVYHCGPSDCEHPLPFEPIDFGQHTGHSAGEFVFHGPDAFEAFWAVHKPNEPMPEVNWYEHMVLAILIGGRPSTGYSVETIEVCLNEMGNPGEGPRIDVKYVENIPGPDCEVMWIGTQPFQIIVVPRYEFPVFFHHEEDVYNCPPTDCIPVEHWNKADGDFSCEPPEQFPMWNNWELQDVWHGIHCGDPDMPPMPPVYWGEEVPFIIQAHEFPTSGYYITVDETCIDHQTGVVKVDWTLHIPAPGCPVEEVLTQPWTIDSIAAVPGIQDFEWVFIGHEQVYECQECEPVSFEQTAQGNESCAETGEYGWQHEDQYVGFWNDVNCWDPGSGDPPPELPGDPEPVNGGIIYHAAVQLPERPSTGYYITFDEVCIEGCDVYIEYTEHIPGENCDVDWVETRPWAITAVELPPVYCYWNWNFIKSEEVYTCPDDPCFDFETVASGQELACEEPGGFLLDNHYMLYSHWMEYHPGTEMPQINFENGWGAYCVHLCERPTTGYEVEVYEICPTDEPFGVAVSWVEWIPGPSCEVEQVQTRPWTLVTMPLVDMPYYDVGFEEIYNCD